MGRFSKLVKGKEVKLGDEVFKITPLTGEHIDILEDIEKDQKTAMYKMVLVSLQKTDETISMNDIKELPIKNLTDLMEAVLEVNELDKE